MTRKKKIGSATGRKLLLVYGAERASSKRREPFRDALLAEHMACGELFLGHSNPTKCEKDQTFLTRHWAVQDISADGANEVLVDVHDELRGCKASG